MVFSQFVVENIDLKERRNRLGNASLICVINEFVFSAQSSAVFFPVFSVLFFCFISRSTKIDILLFSRSSRANEKGSTQFARCRPRGSSETMCTYALRLRSREENGWEIISICTHRPLDSGDNGEIALGERESCAARCSVKGTKKQNVCGLSLAKKMPTVRRYRLSWLWRNENDMSNDICSSLIHSQHCEKRNDQNSVNIDSSWQTERRWDSS